MQLLERWLDENALEDFQPLKQMETMAARSSAGGGGGGGSGGGGGGDRHLHSMSSMSLTARHSEMAKLSREAHEQVGKSAEILKKVRLVGCGVCGVP